MHVLCPKPKYKNIQSTPNTYHLTIVPTKRPKTFVHIHLQTQLPLLFCIKGATPKWELTYLYFVLVNK